MVAFAFSSAGDRELVGSVEVAGVVVAIWRTGGRSTLLLEAVMPARKSRTNVRPVDSGTADISVARERASAFAGEVAALEGVPDAVEDRIRNRKYRDLDCEIDRGGKDVPNQKTQLRAWMRICGLTEDDVVGEEFGESFEVALQTFRGRLAEEGKTPATIHSYVSRIRQVRALACGMRHLETEGLSLAKALDTAIRVAGISGARLAAAVGMPQATLNGWRRGHSLPSETYYPIVSALELVLGLKPGTLTGLLPPIVAGTPPISAFTVALRAGLAASGLSQRELANAIGAAESAVCAWLRGGRIPRRGTIGKIEEILGLAVGALASRLPPPKARDLWFVAELTARQEAEWDLLYRHKTVRDEPDETRRPNCRWRERKDGTCPSADMNRNVVRAFYGFLALPRDAADPRLRGLGVPAGSQSLLDLANLEHVQAFVRFMKERSGAYNYMAVQFINFVCSLLRPGTGYLSQANDIDFRGFAVESLQPEETGSAVGEPTLERWRTHCATVRQKHIDRLKYLTKEKLVKKTRDYRHIDAALRLQHPAKVLVLLERRMREYVSKRWHHAKPLVRARLARDLLLLCMLNRNPLRRSHWSFMTFSRDGRTGHLTKGPDGNYVLRFDREEFKAVAELREDEEYEAEVDPSLTAMIDEYLTVLRPLLTGAARCDLVFRPSPNRGNGDHTRPMCLTDRLSVLTKKFLPDYAHRGFGPHAWRHIIATDLVKNNERDGFALAADALHNTEQMIKEHYGHLCSSDRTKRAHRIIAESLAVAAEELNQTP
jgi:transcriptional regulator with XRE-family HTH domain/integrase/DNA-binding transcriptional regulator YiaG